jgi:hypothetical protein
MVSFKLPSLKLLNVHMASKQRRPNQNKQNPKHLHTFCATLKSQASTFFADIHFGKWHFAHLM